MLSHPPPASGCSMILFMPMILPAHLSSWSWFCLWGSARGRLEVPGDWRPCIPAVPSKWRMGVKETPQRLVPHGVPGRISLVQAGVSCSFVHKYLYQLTSLPCLTFSWDNSQVHSRSLKSLSQVWSPGVQTKTASPAEDRKDGLSGLEIWRTLSATNPSTALPDLDSATRPLCSPRPPSPRLWKKHLSSVSLCLGLSLSLPTPLPIQSSLLTSRMQATEHAPRPSWNQAHMCRKYQELGIWWCVMLVCVCFTFPLNCQAWRAGDHGKWFLLNLI